jgi:hypothetical protein
MEKLVPGETYQIVKVENPALDEQKRQERTKRGYALRNDLVKRLKLIAVQNNRKLYEVMEEAIEQYLDRQV